MNNAFDQPPRVRLSNHPATSYRGNAYRRIGEMRSAIMEDRSVNANRVFSTGPLSQVLTGRAFTSAAFANNFDRRTA